MKLKKKKLFGGAAMRIVDLPNLFGIFILFALTACGGSRDSSDSSDSSDISDNGEESTTLLVRAELPLEVLLGDSRENIVLSVEITGADITKSVKTYPINHQFKSKHEAASSRHVSTGIIEVPTGSDRTFTLRAYQDDIETYRGSLVTDILPGENPTMNVMLQSLENTNAINPKVIKASIGSGAVAINPRIVMCPIGGWRQLSAEIQYELGIKQQEREITWATSNSFVATVTESGLVTVTGIGEAVITATSGVLQGQVIVKGADPSIRDITFFMTADPQYREDVTREWGPNQEAMIDDMNKVGVKPDGTGGIADSFCNQKLKPRGVIVAGDLTQSGWSQITRLGLAEKYAQLDKFVEQWGFEGLDDTDRKPNVIALDFPVFEGYGNHDDLNGEGNRKKKPEIGDDDYLNKLGAYTAYISNYEIFCKRIKYISTDECTNPVIDKIAERNEEREKSWVKKGIVDGFWTDNFTRQGPVVFNGWKGKLHYSWDWGDVHFINSNIYAGKRYYDPINKLDPTHARNGFQFLVNDLKKRVSDTGRPVVIIQHYGFDSFSDKNIGWTCEERRRLAQVTEQYNVIAFFTGHNHIPLDRSVSHDGVIGYTSGAARNKASGYLVVRLIGDQFHVQLRGRDWLDSTKEELGEFQWLGGDSWELPMPEFVPSEPVPCN